MSKFMNKFIKYFIGSALLLFSLNSCFAGFLDSTTYDFGTICNRYPMRRIFTLTNTEPNDLTILSINRVSNIGTSKFSILSPTANSLPQTISSGAKINIIVSFLPDALGFHSDSFNIRMRTTFDINKNFNLKAYVERGDLSVSPSVWDFKTDLANTNVALEVNLKNDGGKDIKILSTFVKLSRGSFYFNSSFTDVKLTPAGNIQTVVSIRPRDTGSYAGEICIVYSQPCIDTLCVPIKGYAKSNATGLLPAIIDVDIPVDVKGRPRDFTSIPITLEFEDNIIQSKARTMHGIMRVRSTLLVPYGARNYEEKMNESGNYLTGNIISSKLDGNDRVVEFEIRNTNYPAYPAIIGYLDAQVLLGDTIHCPLKLDTVFWTDGNVVKVSYRGGTFTLDGFCPYGGNRFIKNNSFVAKINSIKPNLANRMITVNFGVIENGKTSLNIFDAQGNLVKTIFQNEFIDTGLFEIAIDLAEFNSGKYFLRLETPTEKSIKEFILYK